MPDRCVADGSPSFTGNSTLVRVCASCAVCGVLSLLAWPVRQFVCVRLQLKALQSLAAAEAAEAAAASEYHAVAARNEADMAGYIAAQASEMRESLLAVAEVELEHQAVSAEGWLDICRGLGCSSAHIAAIQEL